MTIAKEEIGAAAIAVFAVGGVVAAFWRIVINGGEFSSMGRSPVMVGLFGIGLLASAIYGSRKESFGEPTRNGRRERPFVCWTVLFAAFVAGGGFLTVSIWALFR